MYRELELEILRAFRTKRACAEYLGVHPSLITKIVSGERSLRASEIECLTDRFGINSMDRFREVFFERQLPNGNQP